MWCVFSSLLGRPLQHLFWNLIFIRRTCVCIWPLDLIFPQATQRQCCSLLLKAFCRTGGGGGTGSSQCSKSVYRGAMSAFLDNTPVLGKQVANIFHISFVRIYFFYYLLPKKNCLGETSSKINQKIMPLPRAAPSWGAHVSGSHLAELRGGCMFTSHHKKSAFMKLSRRRLRIFLV